MNSIRPADFVLRPATACDAAAIATMMRASLNSLNWMPVLHTPEEDLLFIRNVILPRQQVTVAEAGEHIVGFIAVRSDWVAQLYLDPVWTGRGVGSRLIDEATAGMPAVKLHCFQANTGARRFYERHGFRAEAFGGGATNEEGLPDILYVKPLADAAFLRRASQIVQSRDTGWPRPVSQMSLKRSTIDKNRRGGRKP